MSHKKPFKKKNINLFIFINQHFFNRSFLPKRMLRQRKCQIQNIFGTKELFFRFSFLQDGPIKILLFGQNHSSNSCISVGLTMVIRIRVTWTNGSVTLVTWTLFCFCTSLSSSCDSGKQCPFIVLKLELEFEKKYQTFLIFNNFFSRNIFLLPSI